MATEPPLIVIVGSTGSGKTALAIEAALQFNGEIICADSRTIYKGMDIGTAKPTAAEQAKVPHWGIDLVEPGERYTVADFQQYASTKINEIRARGKTPLLVGGTGLYIDSVIFNYGFGGQANPRLRERLERLSLDELHEHCNNNNIILPENRYNKRYVIRTIERKTVSTIRNDAPNSDTLIVGIATNMNALRPRIEERAEHMFENGVVEEAKILGKKYGWKSEAMTGHSYPLVKQYLDGMLSEQELKQRFITSDYHLAKRQMTWFRRNPYIEWVRRKEAPSYVAEAIRS